MARILCIDDEPMNRLLVRRILLAEGFDFEEADNALEGIQMAQVNPPDLILMDISMPDMDGLAATQRIRETPAIADITVIALTANAMSGDREHFLNAGCDGYISKPINPDTFVDEISAFLR